MQQKSNILPRDLRPIRASLFTLRRLYYRSIAFSPLQVNVARTIGILPNDRLDFWCGLRTIGSKFKFPHLTQTKTLIHYNYRSFLCESRVVYFWKFRSHSGQYTVRLINTCNIPSVARKQTILYELLGSRLFLFFIFS